MRGLRGAGIAEYGPAQPQGEGVSFDLLAEAVMHQWILRCMDLAKVRAENGLYISNDDVVTELTAILNIQAHSK